MKRILLILLATVFLFTGCASVKYTVVDSGSYLQQNIQINLDSDALSSKSLQLEDVKNEITSVVNRLYENSHNYFINNLQMLIVNESLTPTQANEIMKSICVTKKWIDETTFIYEITFIGINSSDLQLSYTEVFYLYNYGTTIPPEEDDEENPNILTFNFLTTKVQSTQTTAFANNNNILEYFTNKFGEYGFTEDNVKYVYSYGTNYRRLHSDADEINYVNGIYMHTWQLADKNEEITLYRLIPNTTNWYIIALCVGVGTVFTLTFVSIIKKKKATKANQINIDFYPH